ncbi:hypothetical protein ABFS83_02G152000 [Erythranthe nasuta]
MLDSTKLCLSSQFRRAKKLLERKLISFSKKFISSCCNNNNNNNKHVSDLSWLTSSFPSMEISTQLKQVFKIIDANGDGKLSPFELKKVLLISTCHEKAEPAKLEAEAEGIVREMDFNGDGYVDVDEFVITVMGMDGEDLMGSEIIMRSAFRVFDADNNGLISAEELWSVIRRVGFGNSSLRECRKMIEGVDIDGDGFVSFDEFKFMLCGGLS